MERKRKTKSTKTLQVDAILTADWHLREDQPTARMDDFWEAQWKMVDQVKALQKKYKCAVLHSGDLFDHWKPSPRLLSETIKHLPVKFYTVFGNHDLPQHSLDLADKCGITTLAVAGSLTILKEGHWNDFPSEPNVQHPIIPIGRKIYVWHKMVWKDKKPYPGIKDLPGNHWLRAYPEFDIILTGDNHQPFVCQEGGRYLVNPGSLTRQTAAQINDRPRVYLYNAMKNIVKPYFLKCPKGEVVISRQHLEETKERDNRIAAFIERLGTDWEGDLDFQENINRFEKQHDIEPEIMQIVYKSLED